MSEWHLSPHESVSRISEDDPRFITLFRHGSLAVELYAPVGVDRQQPHTRDEIYVVVRGTGWFRRGEQLVRFEGGDFLFVPAGVPHRFEEFSEDFLVWVFFYGPEGGERE